MSPTARLILSIAVAADLFAVVYVCGNLINYGRLIPPPSEPAISSVSPPVEAPYTATAKAPLPPKAAPEPFDLATYLADPVHGAQVASRCMACHTFTPGGADRTGPNLFGIVGAPLAHREGFAYSAAFMSAREAHPAWTEERLHQFLENPRQTVSGTRMIFPGIRDAKDRADLIAWLKTLK